MQRHASRTHSIESGASHDRILEKAHCIAREEKIGMVKLSFMPNGSFSSVSVAA